MPPAIPSARVAKEEVPLTQSGTPSVQVHQVEPGQNLALVSHLYRCTGAQAVVLINYVNEDYYSLPEAFVETALGSSNGIPLFVLTRVDGDELVRCLEEMPSLQCEIAVISNRGYQVSPLLNQRFHSKESRERSRRLTSKCVR